jgi:adenylate kinase family enzyme
MQKGSRRGGEQMKRNREIYWIGGSACAGKSTLARQLAEKYKLALYACDEHYEDQLLPSLVAPLLKQIHQAVWVIPAERFQREQYSKREWIHGILQATGNPELSFSNWMQRDALFADRVKREAEERKLKVLEVDGSRTLEQNFTELECWFGL